MYICTGRLNTTLQVTVFWYLDSCSCVNNISRLPTFPGFSKNVWPVSHFYTQNCNYNRHIEWVTAPSFAAFINEVPWHWEYKSLFPTYSVLHHQQTFLRDHILKSGCDPLGISSSHRSAVYIPHFILVILRRERVRLTPSPTMLLLPESK